MLINSDYLQNYLVNILSLVAKKILQLSCSIFNLSRLRDLNPRPFPYHGNALPAELRRLNIVWSNATYHK